MRKIARELLLILFLLMPLALLAFTWYSIPDTIPVHYGMDGTADRYDSKTTLLWLIPAVQLLIYIVVSLAPFIDPKKRLHHNQGGYYTIRLTIIMFMSTVFISYLVSLTGQWNFSRSIPLFLMAFITALGNYMPILKSNYFIGIRTPWTLESEHVWTQTHRVIGRLWVAFGASGFILFSIWPSVPMWISVAIIIFLALTSVVYSYLVYRRSNQTR
jgi:uncharacterized membrane protein